MTEDDRSRSLPQRERGATPAGASPAPAAAKPQVLTAELRERMQAAVNAERSQAMGVARERVVDMLRNPPPPRRGSDDVASPAASGVDGKRKRLGKAERRGKPARQVNAGVTAAPDPAITADAARTPAAAVTRVPSADHDPADEPEPVGAFSPAAAAPAGRRPAVAPRPPGQPAPLGRPAGPRAGVATKPGHRGLTRTRLTIAALVVIATASAGTALALRGSGSPAGGRSPAAVGQPQDAAARDQAVAWVVQQVSRDAVVSCDQAMCAALSARGFPARNLRVFGPTSMSLAGSAVVVATAAARYQFGTSLSSAWAPDVLATFGSGDAAISVRVVAPHGAGAYERALSADLATRTASGAALLQANDIVVSATARRQLTAGQVDSRLIVEIAALAADEPIDIVQFGNIGPGASADIPLRFADLAATDQASDLDSSAYVQSLRAQLSTGPGSSPPSARVVTLRGGQTVLRIAFTAPSPLGQLGPRGAS